MDKKEKDEILTALEIVVKNFLQPEYVGRWINVRGRSIGNMCVEIGIDKRYSTAIYDELKEIGMIECEGRCAGMRYKIITDVISDYQAVANKIYERHCSNLQSARIDSKKRSSDLNPPRKKLRISLDDMDAKEVRRKRAKKEQDFSRIPHLGQTVFCLMNGYITEADITCVRFDDAGKVKVDFKTPMMDENQVRICKKDYCLRNIAFSVEDLVRKLTSNIQRFKKNEK